MKIRLILSLIAIVLVVRHVSGQQKTGPALNPDTGVNPAPGVKQFIKVTEIDDDGKRIEFKPGYVIVDPNSTLELKIDKAALSAQVNSPLSQDITDRMKTIKNVLMAETEVIGILNKALIAYQNAPAKTGYFDNMKNLAPLVTVINYDSEGKLIRARMGRPGSVQQGYRDLVKTAGLLLASLQDRLLQEAKSHGTVVQLGAWLETKQSVKTINIPGFDTYDPQASSSVERFQINLSSEQKLQLEEISALADSANANGLPSAIKLAKLNLTGLIGDVTKLQTYKNLLTIYDQVKLLAQHTDAELGGSKASVEKVLESLDDFKELAEGFSKKYSKQAASDNFKLLTQVNDDAGHLLEASQTLKNVLVSDSGSLHKQLTNMTAEVQGEVKNVLPLFTKLYQGFIHDFTDISAQAKDAWEQLTAGAELAASAYDFTQKVKQLSLDSLPEIAIVDLNTAGSRDLGDQVTIKLASGPAGGKLMVRELLHYRLYFCKVYARTAVGFLFVSPTPSFKRVDGKAFFRYAPSYSILLKGFWMSDEKSRKSLSYHKLYAPGLGLNFSGLDFNNDGAVELGIGGVFTVFQDFLQLGYGINTESGRGYAFFGFKLPVGSFIFH